MLTWLGGMLYRARWSILILTIVLTGVMAWYGFGVFDNLHGTGLEDPNSESVRAKNLIDKNFAVKTDNTDSLVLLLSNSNMQATDADFKQAATTLFDKLKTRPQVISITSYYDTKETSFLSRDKHQTFVSVKISTKGGSAQAYHALTPYFTSPTLHIDAGGSLAVETQFNDQLKSDLEFAEVIALPIVAVLLVLIFGGLVAAILPLLIGGFAIVGAFAVLRILTSITDVSSFASNVVTIIGLGLAIDYSLFIVTRFREELAPDEKNIRGAIQRTMATAGRTVLFSGLTVCTSLLSLLLFPVSALHSIGIATIVAALVAMLGALTVLPMLLALLGRRVNALSIQRLFRRKKTEAQTQQYGAWYHLSHFVMRRRIAVAVVVITFLLLLGTPFLHAQFAATDERSLPLNAPSRTVAEQIKKNFPGQNDAILTIVTQMHGDATTADNLTKLDMYVSKIKALRGVSSIQSLVSLDPKLTLANYQQLYAHPEVNAQISEAAKQLAKGDVTQIIVTANFDSHSSQVNALVHQMRAISAPAGLTVLVGGEKAQEVDQLASLAGAIPYAVLVMAAAIFVLLFLMTGSLIMPLKAILLNILSLTATFGALVWIFQDGHLQDLLGFKAFGYLDSTQPILIFAIAFGLSMDYEVFLLSRIKEQFDKTGNNKEAVAIGLQKTGWLITSAALLLAVVVSAFATSRIIFIQEIGLGISLAIIMDATLVRGLLVPAMMALLGDLNWWAPRPLRLLWRYIGLHEGTEETETQADKDRSTKEATLV